MGVIKKSWNRNICMCRTNEEFRKLTQEIAEIKKEIHNLERRLFVYEKMYWNISERRVLRESFRKIMDNGEAFQKKYELLIKNLDYEGIFTVQMIINRISKIIDGNEKGIDLFTEDEKKQMRVMNEQFTNRICRISDTLFCYDKYFLPLNAFDSSVFWSRYGLSKCSTLERIKEKCIIDVGAFIGDSALILQEYTENYVYAFEGSLETFHLLKQTIGLNKAERIIPVNKALTSQSGKVQFNIGERISCNGIYKRTGYKYIREEIVESMTLDAFVEEKKLEIGMIKVDIEGGEQDFLKGALKTICEQKPILLMSIYHSADDFFDIKPMIEKLELGYQFTIFKPINPAIVMETVLIAEIKNNKI